MEIGGVFKFKFQIQISNGTPFKMPKHTVCDR